MSPPDFARFVRSEIDDYQRVVRAGGIKRHWQIIGEGEDVRYIVWLPGYAVIAIAYFLPTEWGKNRSVARSGRWWTHRDQLAPVFSVAIYVITAAWLFGETSSRDASKQPVLPTSTVTVPSDRNATNARPATTQTVVSSDAKGAAVPADGDATNKTSVEPTSLDPKTENSSPVTTPTASSAAKGEDVVTPKAACAKAREDVERLEKEKQYSGDDEIVRARMGLPPKPECQD